MKKKIIAEEKCQTIKEPASNGRTKTARISRLICLYKNNVENRNKMK